MLEYEQAINDAGIERNQGPIWHGTYKGTEALLKLLKRKEAGEDIPNDAYAKIDRFGFVQQYSFAIPDLGAIQLMSKYQPLLEVGCGNGYWTYELRKAGIEVVATDKEGWKEGTHQSHYKFHRRWIVDALVMEGTEAVRQFPNHTLFLCWPSYAESWATETLKEYKGEHLIYIGEVNGCCADDEFFEVLEKQFDQLEEYDIPQWYGIHDYLIMYQRKNRQ